MNMQEIPSSPSLDTSLPAESEPPSSGQGNIGSFSGRQTHAVRITPYTPQPPRGWFSLSRFMSCIVSDNPTTLLTTGSLQNVQEWTTSGGNLEFRDDKDNNVIHLLARARGDQCDYSETKKIAREIFQHYPLKKMQALCAERNNEEQTPWHTATLGSRCYLRNGSLAIVESMLLAGASPLQANDPKYLEDYPAVALLPNINPESRLMLRLMIKLDPYLQLKPITQSEEEAAPQVFESCPNLLCAAIHKKQPHMLQELLKQGARVKQEESPTYYLFKILELLHTSQEYRACAQVLADLEEKLPPSALPDSLLPQLKIWEDTLAKDPETGDEERRDKNRRENIKMSFQCMLPLLPSLTSPLKSCPPETGTNDGAVLRGGLLPWIASRYPKLFEVAQDMPELQPLLNEYGYSSDT